MAPKHFLNNITVPSPCTADWNSMIGNDQVRFCGHCNLKVHNLSQMTRSQAERLVGHASGRLCVRYHHDSTDQPLTLPVRRKLHRISRGVSRIAAGAFTATLSVTSAVAQSSPSSQSADSNPATAAQVNTRWTLRSSVAGVISDQNAAVIPGATIAIWNEQSRGVLYASTDFKGQFKIDSLEAGSYQVRIEAPGFAAQESGIYAPPNGEARLDRTLSIAAIEETVEIQDESRFVQISGGAVAFVAPEHTFVRAAQEDDLETLTSLIAGMDVNLRDKRSGTTALDHAVKNANREMVQLLISAGANVNAKNESGETVLMMLDGDATSDLVWDLLNSGANVKLTDNDGNTALMRIATSTNLEALKALVDAGADVNAKNKQGLTALMHAASEGTVNAVRALVLAGADIDAIDEGKRTALDLAAENDRLPVVRFLKSKGAFQTVAQVESKE